MKTKIVFEDFDEKSGITTVTIQNKYGHFTGIAKCNPVDEYSMFHGERIAVTRAHIDYCKLRMRQDKAKLEALEELQIKDKYTSNYDLYLLRKQIWDNRRKYSDSIQHWKDAISILENSIKLMDEERQKILLRSKKNK